LIRIVGLLNAKRYSIPTLSIHSLPFSLLESHILLALLARRFAPRLAEGYEPRWVMKGVLGTEDGLPMVINARVKASQLKA